MYAGLIESEAQETIVWFPLSFILIGRFVSKIPWPRGTDTWTFRVC